MKFREEEKCINTDELNITGNIMTWKGTMIQLANVSYITSTSLALLPFPWIAAGIVLLGLAAITFSWIAALVLVIAGGAWFWYWYAENDDRKSQIILTIAMNSGNKLQLLFYDKKFLNKVMGVLEKIMIDGGVGRQDVSINISDCEISGNAKVLSDLDM